MHLPHKKYPSEYWSFIMAKQRCNNPNNGRYKDWGGKGIRVAYASFDEFFDDLGPKPGKGYSLDRIDNTRNYEPGNCRWATTREQAINRSDNVRISLNGQVKTLVEWCEELNLSYGLVRDRLSLGWPAEKAFFTPKNAHLTGRKK